jgi:Family of unknown function (DUF5343)
MGLADAYVQGYGKIPELFGRIRDAQAPEQFTHQLLKDWGFSSSNDRQFLQLLKALGFLSPDGKPTSRYLAYRDHSRSRSVMAEALREAYQDIFLIKATPAKDDRQAIEGKFRSYHNASERVAQLMTTTFLALLSLADVATVPKPIEEKKLGVAIPKDDRKEESEGGNQQLRPPGLHYNIQIHLPATKDVEVYNAIFKSLKEHLFEL